MIDIYDFVSKECYFCLNCNEEDENNTYANLNIEFRFDVHNNAKPIEEEFLNKIKDNFVPYDKKLVSYEIYQSNTSFYYNLKDTKYIFLFERLYGKPILLSILCIDSIRSFIRDFNINLYNINYKNLLNNLNQEYNRYKHNVFYCNSLKLKERIDKINYFINELPLEFI